MFVNGLPPPSTVAKYQNIFCHRNVDKSTMEDTYREWTQVIVYAFVYGRRLVHKIFRHFEIQLNRSSLLQPIGFDMENQSQ